MSDKRLGFGRMYVFGCLLVDELVRMVVTVKVGG